MTTKTDTHIQSLIAYLEQFRQGETYRSLEERSGVSRSAIGDLFAGIKIPKAEFLRKICEALGANQITAFQLAGYIQGDPTNLTAPEILALVERLEDISPEERAGLLRAFQAMLDAVKPRERTTSDD